MPITRQIINNPFLKIAFNEPGYSGYRELFIRLAEEGGKVSPGEIITALLKLAVQNCGYSLTFRNEADLTEFRDSIADMDFDESEVG